MGHFFDNLNQDNFSVNLGSNVQFTDYYSYQYQHTVSNNGSELFAYCNNYNSSFNIPDSIVYGYYMFGGCNNLNQPIHIDPYNSSLTIMNYMFYGCNNFNQDVNIPRNVIYYERIFDYTYNYNANVYVYARSYGSEPNNYYYAFSYQSGFNGNVHFMDGTSPQNMCGTFYDCYQLNQNIQIPSTATDLQDCFCGCGNLNQNIKLPDNVTAVECFGYCRNLNISIAIPNNSNISYMFYECANLNKPFYVPVPRGTTENEHIMNSNGLFLRCYNFNSGVTFASGWKGMGAIFAECYNFNHPIAFPEGVENLYSTFINCYNFNTTVSLASTIQSMQETFHRCTNFNQLIELPSSLSHMWYTFSHCYNLDQNIQIPSGVTYMSGAFSQCQSLNQEIHIPDSVTDVGRCFSYCERLNSNVRLGAGVTDASGTFGDCDALNQNISLPSSLINAPNMFENCSSLNQNIYLPESLVNITTMFYNCMNLNQPIVLPTTNLVNATYAFTRCLNLHIPEVIFGSNCNRMKNCCQYTKIRNITIQSMDLDFYDLVNGGLFTPIPRQDPLLYSPDVTGLTPAQCDEYGRVVSYGDTLFHINMPNDATVWYNFTQSYYPYRTYNYEYNVEIAFHTIEGAGGPSPYNAAWLFGATSGYVSGNYRGTWGPCNYRDYTQNFQSNGTPYFSWAGTYTGTDNCIVYLYWDWANLASGSETPPKYTCLLNFT